MRLFIKMPEAINEAVLHKRIDPSSFFGQKSATVGVILRVMDINRLMANVVITANDELWSFLF